MKAAVTREVGAPLVHEDRSVPEPRGDEVLVRVRAVGVCHSDLHLVEEEERPRPLVLGHEIAGAAEEVGDVLVYPTWGCLECRFCRAGEEQLCSRAETAGFTRDGGYAEYVLVPSRRYLLPLQGLDPVRAAPLADAGVTPYRAVRRVREHLADGATLVVLGAGGLGQFAVQYAKLLTAARVVAVDIDERKRARALELGADEALAPEDVDEPAAAVIDFVGADETLVLGAQLTETAGAILHVGAAGGRLLYGFNALRAETTIGTSILGSLAELRAVLTHARRGDLRWDGEVLPLERANEALDRLRRGDVVQRLVLTP
jgi:alcohol dehydrogenase, propanol-preferring